MKPVNYHTKGCLCLMSKQIDSRKEKSMNLKKAGKKIAVLALAVAMAVGGSLSVFAATGFTVSEPSLSINKDVYYVTGGMSYYSSTSSTSYYLLVNVKGVMRVNVRDIIYENSGYGYGKASATTEGMPIKPWYMENKGSYNSGTGFTVVDTKAIGIQ